MMEKLPIARKAKGKIEGSGDHVAGDTFVHDSGPEWDFDAISVCHISSDGRERAFLQKHLCATKRIKSRAGDDLIS